MRNGFAAALLAAGLIVTANDALAQQGTAEIRGRVLDQSGAALPGATVVVRNQASGVFRQGVSTGDGSYFLTGVIPGVYELSAELTGFKKYQRKDVRLEVGKTATLDVSLEVGGLAEQVEVAAESPIVDVTSKEVGGQITNTDLISLPSVNRNFIGFIGLLPGVVPSISTESFGSDSVSVNGQDARNNNYLVDGANNNDDVIGQRAGTQARTPIESIQEFQVLTSQYDAEFGRSTGAIINAVTKQGANAFHGSAFYFLQDASFTHEDFFVEQSKSTANPVSKPDTRFQQLGGTIGGPLIKNKLHFFGSLERVLNDRATTINIPARPEFNASPTTEDRVWNWLVRLDHQINAQHSWNVRWLKELSPQQNQIIPDGTRQVTQAASREEDDLDQTLALSLNSSFGNTKFNTLRAAYTQEDVAFANPNFNSNGQHGDQLLPTLQFLTFIDQQSSVMQARVNDAYQIDDTFSWFIPGNHGGHNIRAGIQYEYVKVFSSAQDNWNGTFSFRSDRNFNAADPTTYPERLSIRVPGPSEYTQKEHFWSVFAQDKWKLNPRLTLSLGARYDVEKIPIPQADNPYTSEAPVDHDNISPRVGFAYDLKGDGRTVLRGGAGRFYDKSHLELISAFITAGYYSNSFTVNFPTNNADPGPSQGRLPTDPMLVNGPTVNRTLLNQLYPPGSRLRNTGTVNFDNPDRVIPYTDQLSIGGERALSRDVSLGVDYVHAFGRDQFMSYQLNPGVRTSTSRTGTVVRVDPNYAAAVNTIVNEGRTEYDAVMAMLEKRYSNNYQFRLSYTWAKGSGNTSGTGAPASNFQFLSDMNLDQNQGPTDLDRPHNLVFSGAAKLPRTGGVIFSTVVRYLSGTMFTVQDTNFDNDQNGILFEPLPAGTYTGTGTNALTVDNAGGRNGARGPSFFQWDARLGYRFSLGGARSVEAFAEMFNVTNRANFANPTGDRFSTNFLRVTAFRPGGIPRTAQFGARFAF
jgi:hypothetical protein